MWFGLKRNTSAEDGTPVSSLPLKIIDPHEELSDPGIKSIHFLSCAVELGRMLTQSPCCTRAERSGSDATESIAGQTVLSGNKLDSDAGTTEAL